MSLISTSLYKGDYVLRATLLFKADMQCTTRFSCSHLAPSGLPMPYSAQATFFNLANEEKKCCRGNSLSGIVKRPHLSTARRSCMNKQRSNCLWLYVYMKVNILLLPFGAIWRTHSFVIARMSSSTFFCSAARSLRRRARLVDSHRRASPISSLAICRLSHGEKYFTYSEA